jgi:four helix bundle protein
MPFQVEELSLELIDALAPLMPRIKQRDKDLADQLRRAASSIGLNCAEASFSDPGNRKARLFTAAGSAGETRHALRQAIRLAQCHGGGSGTRARAASTDHRHSLADDARLGAGAGFNSRRLHPKLRKLLS